MRGRFLLVLLSGLLLTIGCVRQPVSLDNGWTRRSNALEEKQQKIALIQQELQRKDEELEKRLVGLDARVGRLEKASAATPSQVASPGPETAKDMTRSAPSVVCHVSAGKGRAKISNGVRIEYERALKLFRSGHVEEGRKALLAYKEHYPDSPLMPNVLYWLGESQVDQKHYARAIMLFKEIPRTFPSHAKAPDALFKIVTCYMALGDRGNSAFYMGILLDKYGDSHAARLVHERFPKLLPAR